MTDRPDEPLRSSDAVDPTDERLSAALDGEGDTEELGASATAARARALESARDLVATPPPALDDVTRRRLLDTARAAGTAHRRDRSRWAGPAAAAAAVVVVVLGGWALVAGLHGPNDSSKGSKAASGASATTAANTGTAPSHSPASGGALGEVSDPERLLAQVRGELHTTADSVQSQAGADKFDALPGARCASTLRVPAGVTPEILGPATFHGASAVVLVGREKARVLVYVLASSDCRLLSAQFFTR